MKTNPQRPLNTTFNVQHENAEREAIFQRERKAAIAVHVPGQAGIVPGPAQPRPPVTNATTGKKRITDDTKA